MTRKQKHRNVDCQELFEVRVGALHPLRCLSPLHGDPRRDSQNTIPNSFQGRRSELSAHIHLQYFSDHIPGRRDSEI